MNRPIGLPFVASCALATLLSTAVDARDTGNSTDDVPQRSVKYTNLDLTRADGVARLYARIGSAAREVCPSEDSASLYLARLARECVRDAVARAVRDVGAPTLTQYHMTRANQRVLLAEQR